MTAESFLGHATLIGIAEEKGPAQWGQAIDSPLSPAELPSVFLPIRLIKGAFGV